MNKIVLKSYEVSIILLLITSIITLIRSLNNIKDIDKLKLQISTAVTGIATCHYYLMITSPEKVVLYRYLDWFFTTPLLLVDLCLSYNIKDFNFITEILIYNTIMICTGFLGEINYLNKYISMGLGFTPMILIFYKLYNKMEKTYKNKRLLKFFILIWSLYGLIFPIKDNNIRNLSYNILDIISKGGVGGYLYYESWNNINKEIV